MQVLTTLVGSRIEPTTEPIHDHLVSLNELLDDEDEIEEDVGFTHFLGNDSSFQNHFRSVSFWKNVSAHALKDALVSLSPNSVTNEMLEMIEELMSKGLDENESEYSKTFKEELKAFQAWLISLIEYKQANLELDPVKDYLRKSMARIDVFRKLQRRLGMRFLD